jgi:hypothetical protein
MTWENPKTWVTGELVTAAMLNTHVRDNLNALKSPPSDDYVCNEVSDYLTTSTSFVNVDATNLALTINTGGGDVMLCFSATVHNATAAAIIFFDVEVDGNREAGDDGLIEIQFNASAVLPVSFVRLITGLAEGSHTFKLQWKVSAGTGRIYAGAGTSSADVHPQLWAREVS